MKTYAPYIYGYNDGAFRPQGLIRRSEAAMMFTRAGQWEDPSADTNAFSDLASGAWYRPCVAVMVRQGVINGYPDKTFRPEANVTRAEFVTMVCRIANAPDTSAPVPYIDLSGHWASKNIHNAAAQGWLGDFTDLQFQPNKAITRGEAVQILNRATGRDKMEFVKMSDPFSDVPQGSPLYDAVMRAAGTMK